MRVLVSGATGMVGRALVEHLAKPTLANNFAPEVFSLVRRTTGLKPNEISWDPYEHRIDIKRLEGFDAVVHLAGVCTHVTTCTPPE
jgi:nucleoside-diphosphate-sugar epimerase